MLKGALIVVTLAALSAAPALAHVTLERRQAPVGSFHFDHRDQHGLLDTEQVRDPGAEVE